ncbi:MAG TPA: Gfo/Idh/MocA family oxidoreductase [Chloroflexota bacterium]|nr:Gfo/Idh/MocA family oxidoreductase [Chloroflexota bacterium]
MSEAGTPGASATRPYRVACIGAARMASWFDDVQRERAASDGGRSLEWVPGAIAPLCRAIERAELVAVCDLKPDLVEQMRQRWDVPAGYTDWREMVARERPDVVAIVTAYGSIHATLGAEVAETGLVRGIYCEKPIATSMAEADRIVAACRANGVAYTCAHVARWNARYRQVCDWIAAGEIGEVRAVTVSAMGTLLHSGTHQTDAMAGFAGDVDPEWASGAVEVPAGLPQAEWPLQDPPGGGHIRLRNGVDLLMEARSPGPRTYQISGSEGKIHIWNDLQQIQLWKRIPGRGRAELAPGPLLSPPQERSYAQTQLEELLDVLDRDGKGQIGCDAVRAARALEMVLGLHLSHRAGGARVPFPLAGRAFGVDTK